MIENKIGEADGRGETHTHLISALPSRQDRSLKSVVKIVDAAQHVLQRDGHDAFSMSSVAMEAGVSVGGIYRRFADKGSLLISVKDLALRRAWDRFEAALSEGPFTSADAIVAATVAGLCAGVGEEEALHRALFEAGRRNPAVHQRGLESRARASHVFHMMLLPYLRGVDQAEARRIVVVMWEIMLGSALKKVDTESGDFRALSWADFQLDLTIAIQAYFRARVSFAGRTG